MPGEQEEEEEEEFDPSYDLPAAPQVKGTFLCVKRKGFFVSLES